MFKKITIAFIVAISFWGCQDKTPTDLSKIAIIPKPVIIAAGEGHFEIDSDTRIMFGEGAEPTAKYLQEALKLSTGYNLDIEPIQENRAEAIVLMMLKGRKESESYLLSSNSAWVEISASSNTGLFYGVQTLRQLLPVENYSATVVEDVEWLVPSVDIQDTPRFKWRGLMLDVSRHFYPVEFIKQNLDWLAQHKINRFHWHLIDDQGWRVEIKKYPKLTENSAWRVDHEDKDWSARPEQKDGEKATYGGFYTQEQIKEVVAYAAERHITVVPEIEMPAHVTCLFNAYPELSCKGEHLPVPSGGLWPITDIYCAGNEATFEFISDVMDEIIPLFPGKYIHIGGDEANKKEWEVCPKCQAVMKSEKLKDTHELQSYFISRVEKILNEKGRDIIGWDEILEGGLAPNATVMSWRGMKGGIKAAKSGHNVIMTPTGNCYFDYYQGPRELEPQAFNASLPISKVYSFNPTPKELTKEESKFVLGGQANLWTEHVQTIEHAQYMIYPRIAALAEAVWTLEGAKDWDNFSSRLNVQMKRYKVQGINYASSAYNVASKSNFDAESKVVTVELSSEIMFGDFYYTTDGTDPTVKSTLYSEPFKLNGSCLVKMAQFKDGEMISTVNSAQFYVHLATTKEVTYINECSEKYTGQGEYTLVNTTLGTGNHSDGQWQAWDGEDMIVSIDLGSEQSFKTITVGHKHDSGAWIFTPTKDEFFTSNDGTNWTKVGEVVNDYDMKGKPTIRRYEFKSDKEIKARYVKVAARILDGAPEWHSDAGGSVWLFTDEIVVQ